MEEIKKEDSASARALGRRDMMKMGVGAGIAMTQLLKAPAAFAQGKFSIGRAREKSYLRPKHCSNRFGAGVIPR